jgi:hypothetical protein
VKRSLSAALAASLTGVVVVLCGCEQHFFKSQGVVSSDGGQLFAWSRPVQGCSPDPLDGQPVGKSATLFTLYWDNPIDRDAPVRHNAAPENKLQRLEISRGPDGLTGSLKTTLIDPDTVLDSKVCTTFKATTTRGKPVIAGGRPTVNGTLDLDCHVADSHLTASVRFTGCEY